MNKNHHLPSAGEPSDAFSKLVDDGIGKIMLTANNVDLTVDVDSDIEDSLDDYWSGEEENGEENSDNKLSQSISEDSIVEDYAARLEEGILINIP